MNDKNVLSHDSGDNVDRTLSKPETSDVQSVNYLAPQKDMEKILTDIWQRVLQLEKVEIDSSFFDLGGDSFDMVKVYDELKKILNFKISVIDLFKYPTIEGMAKYLTQEGYQEKPAFGQIHNKTKRQKESLKRKKQLINSKRKIDG